MARPLRLQVADGVYHLTARGNERKVIIGSDDFVRLHLAGVHGSREIPQAHLRPPRPALEEVLSAPGETEPVALAYQYGYTMPAIAQHLGLHPSTVSRRLSRHRAQIKT